MKHAIAILAVLAASCGVAAPAVTPRQMTNYVSAVEERIEGHITSLSNFTESVSAAGLSNYVHAVTDELKANNLNALTEVSNVTSTAVTEMEDIRDAVAERAEATSNYYVVVEGELVAVSNYVSNVSPAGLSNYVNEVVNNINQSLVNGMTDDDEVHFDGNRTAHINVPMVVNKVVTNVMQTYTVEDKSRYGTNWAFRVSYVTGHCPVTNGEFLAFCEYNGYYAVGRKGTFKEVWPINGETNTYSEGFWFIWSENGTQTSAYSNYVYSCYEQFYNKTATYTYNEDPRYCLISGEPITIDNSETVIKWGYYNYDGAGTWTNCPYGSFRITPYLVYDETYTNIAPVGSTRIQRESTSLYWFDYFAKDSVLRESEVKLQLTPNTRLQSLSAPRRSKSGLPLLGDGGLPQKPTSIVIDLYANPTPAVKVDTYEYAESRGDTIDGEAPTPDNCVASPSMVYTEEDWYNLDLWIKWPESGAMDVTTYYQGEDGSWYPKKSKIRNKAGLEKALGDYPDTKIPPYPWGGYTLTKKKSCAKGEIGHIWRVNLDSSGHAPNEYCKVCGATREHSFSGADAYTCDSCHNYLTKSKTTLYGEEPDGDDDMCGAWTDSGLLSKHGGWYHEEVSSAGSGLIEDEYQCSCMCGLYSVGGTQNKHAYDTSSPTTWEDTGDGYHHKGACTCGRASCNHVGYVKKAHEMEKDTRYSSTGIYVNNSQHKVRAKCSANGCTFGQSGNEYIYEEHSRDSYCWCSICSHYCHSYTHSSRCGDYDNTYCVYCGAAQSGTGYSNRHWFSPAIYEDGEYHTCHCGEKTHKHKYNDDGVCVGTTSQESADDSDDVGCGNRKTKGNKYACRHKIDQHDDPITPDTHPSGEGVFPDDPGGGNPSQCSYCGGKSEDDIPEDIRDAWSERGYSYMNIPWCWYELNFFWFGDNAGAGQNNHFDTKNAKSKYSFCEQLADEACGYSVGIATSSGLSMGFVMTFHLPDPRSIQSIITNNTFVTGVNVGNVKTNYLYKSFSWAGTVVQDSETEQWGVSWK